MKKQRPLKCLTVLILFILQAQAQNGNETLGGTVTPSSGDPSPYTGAETLLVTGSSISTGDYNTLIGDGAGYRLTSGKYNTFLGTGAGALLTTQSDNVIIGAFAADQTNLTSPSIFDNVIIGARAARTLESHDNVVIGTEAGMVMTDATYNVLIGERAGYSLTDGDGNVCLGYRTGYSITTANDNVFIGARAGYHNTSGYGNIFVGGDYGASLDGLHNYNNTTGWDNTTGSNNTFLGAGTGGDNGSGSENTFIGGQAGARNEHANFNTFVGFQAGIINNRSNSTTNAMNNTFVGWRAGAKNEEGMNNVIMGYDAGFETSDGTNNSVIIGSSAKTNGSTDRNNIVLLGANAISTNNNTTAVGANTDVSGNYSVAIGTGASATTNNSMVLGGVTPTDRVSVGIGTTAPNQNASIELADTDKGLLINRLTNAQRATLESKLSTIEGGILVFDIEDKELYAWDGIQWKAATKDTDDQTIDVFQLTDNNLELSLINDGENTKIIDLSKYLDNTDNQELSLVSNLLGISNGTSSIDLAPYLDNTDSQTLNISNGNLSISGGNSVDLSSLKDGTGTDNQNLTGATLNGNNLTLSIENGNSVVVDLSTILIPLQNENITQQIRIDDLIDRIETLEACACQSLVVPEQEKASDRSILYQNIPNPFSGNSSIKYYLSNQVNKADIVFSNTSGQIVSSFELKKKSGEGELRINSNGLSSGTYFYTLYTDDIKIDTKKMVIE